MFQHCGIRSDLVKYHHKSNMKEDSKTVKVVQKRIKKKKENMTFLKHGAI